MKCYIFLHSRVLKVSYEISILCRLSQRAMHERESTRALSLLRHHVLESHVEQEGRDYPSFEMAQEAIRVT
jgi:predicted SAM-dependent methyltransferase